MFLTSMSVDFFSSAIDFFNNVGAAIAGGFNLIVSSMREVAAFIGAFLDLIPFFPIYVSWLPGSCAAVLSTVLTVAVLYRVLGWGD